MKTKWEWIVERKNTKAEWFRCDMNDYGTKREADNAMASISLREYERTGNFAHDANLRVKRTGATVR